MGKYILFTVCLHRYFHVEKQRFTLNIYDASINCIHADQLYNAISPLSCFLDIVTPTFARHSLNARNVINWKHNFKKKYI